MRIVYAITKASWGGAQRYVYDLAAAARGAGHEVVGIYGEEGVLSEKLADVHIRTTRVRGLMRDVHAAEEPRALAELVRLFRAERPDIVHLNSSKAGFLGALAARLARVPRILFTAHGWAFNEDRPWWERAAIRLFAWCTVLLSHKTICVSEAVSRDIAWLPFASRRLVVIYNGVSAPAYETRANARERLWPHHEDDLWVGMLSELHPTKRIEDAIAAIDYLREEYPNLRLVILGEGQERSRLTALIAEYRLEEHVHLAGFVPSADRYLTAFDLFLHTSRSEALAYAPIEAGLAGLPVVATKVGGLPEIIADGETGMLVPPCAPKKIADALRSLIEDPLRAAHLGTALKASAERRFDPARMAQETFAVYQTGRR